MKQDDEEVARIFDVVTRSWQGSMMLFPHKCADGTYRNIVIKDLDILAVIRKAVDEAEERKV